MGSILRSKLIAWLALFIIIAVIIITFRMRPAWWAFFDEFFAFMMVFSQLASLYIYRMSAYAARKLQTAALVFGVLMVLAIIGEFIAYQVIYR